VLRLFVSADGIIAASEFMNQKICDLGCPRDNISVAHCGVDPQRFRPSTREPGLIAAVGRLVEVKAPHLTIRAFAKVRRKHPGARLEVVGDGDLRALCESTIKDCGLEDAVVMHGARPTAFCADLMSRASIFVQHSVTAENGDTEGLGVSLLEAMASAVPVVATRHNGFIETVVHGETGFLVEEHDIDGMAAAIDTLLDNPERARTMGEAGRRRVMANFTQKLTATRLRSIFGIGEGLKESGAVMDLSDGKACGSKR
jgi:colanic acid/amylovoran biosynthesis glycosyltransferase